MKASTVSALALAAGASAQSYNITNPVLPPKYTTKVVSYYETYCPYATVVPINGVTYTVTKATTIKVTNCPCTVTYANPAYTSTPVVYTSAPVVAVSSAPAVVVTPAPPAVTSAVVLPPPAVATSSVPAPPAVVIPPPAVANATVPAVGTGSPAAPASPSISAFKGAGNQLAASGASLVAVMGLAAYLL